MGQEEAESKNAYRRKSGKVVKKNNDSCTTKESEEQTATYEDHYRKKDGSCYKIEQKIYREKRKSKSKYDRSEPDRFIIVTKGHDEEGDLLYEERHELREMSLDDIKYDIGSLREKAMDEIGVTYKDSSRATFGDDYRDKVDEEGFKKQGSS